MEHTFKLISSESFPLTPALVDEFVHMKPSITERPLEQKRIVYINSRIMEGLAVPFNWAKAQIEGEDTWYRVNGQHSSKVLSALNGEIPKGLRVHVDSYRVPDKEALVQLFRQYDPKASSRTPLDVTNAYASVNSHLEGVDRKIIKIAAEAIWWWRKHVRGEKDTAIGDDRYGIVMEDQYTPYFVLLDRRILTSKTPELRPVSVLAAIWTTFTMSPDVAAPFWENVAHAKSREDGSDAEEPGIVLDDYLLKVNDKKIEDVSPSQLYQGCIYAWNAHVDGKSITRINTDLRKGFLEPKFPASAASTRARALAEA